MQQVQGTSTTAGGYSADTEILTRAGWKPFAKLGDDDEVATRNPVGLFQWQKPTVRTEREHSGEMIAFTGKQLDLLVTPEHPVLVRRPYAYGVKHPYAEGLGWHMRPAGVIARAPEMRWIVPATSRWNLMTWPADFVLEGWKAERRHPAYEHATEWLASYLTQDWTPAGEVVAAFTAAGISHHAYGAARKNLGITSRRVGGIGGSWEVGRPTKEHVPSSGAYTPMRDLHIPMKAFCAFLGLYLAEGWVRKDRNDVFIAQYPTSRHLPRIWEILNATGLCWNYNPHVKKFTTSHKTLAPWLRENCGYRAWRKRVPDGFKDLPADHLAAMLEGMMMGDGHETVSGQRCYTTTSPQLADDVQEIFQKTGTEAWIDVPDFSKYECGFGSGDNHTTYVARERRRADHLLPKPARTEYSGMTYHVQVPNGVVYVRRGARPRPAWCG